MKERRRGHGRRRSDSPDAAAAPHLRDALESQARMIRALARTRDGILRQRDALRHGLDALDEALGRGDVDAARAVVGYLRWEQDRIAEDHAAAHHGDTALPSAGERAGGSDRVHGDATRRPRSRRLDAAG